MTREEAIELLDNLIGFVEDNHGSDYDEALKIAIKALEQRWIPVSERMPEEHKDVLTCGLGGFIEIQSFENAYDGYWENQNGAWSDLDEVAAWMPLPEPYRAESEET